jgi:hypothetical protein
LDQFDDARGVREAVVAQGNDRALRAGLDALDAGFATVAFDRE